MSESTRTNLRERLRSATMESHAKLDGVMSCHPPFASAENYCRYLLGMEQLHQACDASVQWVEAQTLLEPHSISLRNLIRSDVESVGLPGVGEVSSCSGLSVSATAGTHWGRAYVMEGSSMGATFLIKQAEKELPDNFGRSYLRQLAADAKQRWSVFAAQLSNADAQPQEAVDAAVDVFEYAYRIFGR